MSGPLERPNRPLTWDEEQALAHPDSDRWHSSSCIDNRQTGTDEQESWAATFTCDLCGPLNHDNLMTTKGCLCCTTRNRRDHIVRRP